jgi:proteasome accessory factor A
MLEDTSFGLKDMTLENPIRAIREISSDITCRRKVRLSSGREMSALDIQVYLLERALEYELSGGFSELEVLALRNWEYVLGHLEQDPMKLDTELDWVIKLKLLQRYADRESLDFASPEVQLLELQYHDINPARGIFHRMSQRGLVKSLVTADEISHARQFPPETTRARLRGDFVRRAKEKGRDVTVDWVHLKVNDQLQRTIVCKDPFASRDERVERLIQSL